MIKVLIVDDEPLARENLRVFLQEQSDIEIVGECSNAVEGIGAVHKLRPDVLFLDIQMPRISGLEMVGMLDPEHRPYIVFLTAFDEYAIKAFEEHAFDYLLKPIDEARLEKTLARLRQERSKQDVSLLPENQQALKFIPCTGHSRIYLLQMKDCGICQQSDERCLRYQPRRERGLYRIDITYHWKVVHHYCAAIVSIWLTSRIYRRFVWKITARPS